MKKLLLFSIFFLYLLGSCQKKSETPSEKPTGLFTKHITVDGTDRRYAIYIPKNLDAAASLVFELHGGGVYIEDMTGQSGHKTPYKLWMALAEREHFIVVYPEGLNGAYNKPTWNDCRGDCTVNSTADDVHFIDTLIQEISQQYTVDTNRVYVSGTSNGGFMAFRLAIELSDKIAAISTVVASLPALSSCPTPSRPIPVLFMNGTNDNHLPYNGGLLSNPPNPAHGTSMAVEEAVQFWVNFNQTDSIPTHYTFPDLDPDDGGVVEKFSYLNGTDHTEVIFYKVNGGGHSAPSILEQYSSLFEQYFNKQNHDIEMTREAWHFFKDKRLRY